MPTQKTYYANTVESALAMARKDGGEDTLLIDSGPAQGEERRMGAHRVVVELPDGTGPKPEGRQSDARLGRVQEPAVSLAAVEAELSRLSSLVAMLAAGVCGTGCAPELRPAAAALSAADLPGTLVQDVLDRVEKRLRLRVRPEPVTASQVRQAVREEVESRIFVDATLGRPGARRKIVALAGPAGAGKTTTLVKLAMRAGVAARRPALILSTDTHRVAAAEQLRSYAAILGLPFALAETPGSLVRTIEEHRQKELILIDSPGFSQREQECAQEWAGILGADPEIEVQLVLPATGRPADLLATMRWWESYRPSKLIFTHLDETSCAGACLAVAMISGMPVSYLSMGQRVPEDLMAATKAGMAEMVLGESRVASAAA